MIIIIIIIVNIKTKQRALKAVGVFLKRIYVKQYFRDALSVLRAFPCYFSTCITRLLSTFHLSEKHLKKALSLIVQQNFTLPGYRR